MISIVLMNKYSSKQLRRIPKYIVIQFDLWVEVIETQSFEAMQEIKGYNDHALIGDRKGQRSSYLSRSWRVIYTKGSDSNRNIIEVLEINHHDY